MGWTRTAGMGKPPYFRWLLEECRHGVEDLIRYKLAQTIIRVFTYHGLDRIAGVGELPSFRWLPEECRQGVEDPYKM